MVCAKLKKKHQTLKFARKTLVYASKRNTIFSKIFNFIGTFGTVT